MTRLKLYEYPHQVLKQKCVDVSKEEFNDELKQLLDDMLETMYLEAGVGLAAPQVGITRRIVVIDVERDEDGNKPGNPIKMVNPEIVWRSEEIVCGQEGCLSVPGQHADVERNAEVRVSFYTPEGEKVELLADGLLAIAVQHELDHLDGILYIDRISRLKRQMLIKKMNKSKK